jgi:hypothetical protein
MGTGSNMTELTIDVKLLDLNKVKSKTEDESKLKGSLMATLAEDVRGGDEEGPVRHRLRPEWDA